MTGNIIFSIGSLHVHLLCIVCRKRAVAHCGRMRRRDVRSLRTQAVRQAADTLRRRVCGDVVSYVVNRNINYTNVCLYKCQFCAFSKGKARAVLWADTGCTRSAAQWVAQ